MDLAEAARQLEMNKRESCLSQYVKSVTPPPDKGGKWQTTIRTNDGSRKNFKAKTKDELLDKVFAYCTSLQNLDKLTFDSLFDKWIDHKSIITDSHNTIKRHRQHYKKYFAPSKLSGMRISTIRPITLEEECNRMVKDFAMTRKEWTNVKTILIGMFDYAMKFGYITSNPIPALKITVKYKQVNRKTGKTETYNTEELEALNTYLDQKFEETKDPAFMAVRLNFYLGLRVAELVALKWEDWCDLKHLHITREEVRNQVTYETTVVPHTKTNTDRFVALVPKAISILSKLPRTDEYIFVRSSGRLIAKDIATVLEKYAKEKGIPCKSTHKIRKTYASMLNANGVPLDAIRENLGHADLKTTLGYLFNPLTEKETYDLIKQAL